MKPSLLISLLGLSLTSLATAQTIYQIDLRSHMSLLSNDRPNQRGRLALFHRYPDGVFLSIPEEEIVRVVRASASPTSKTLVPGEAIDVGPTGGGHRPELPTPEGSAEADTVRLTKTRSEPGRRVVALDSGALERAHLAGTGWIAPVDYNLAASYWGWGTP